MRALIFLATLALVTPLSGSAIANPGPLGTGDDSLKFLFPPPRLKGHQDNGGGKILPYDVQAAFNDDTFFWRVSYRGNEGKRHEYLRYTKGEWQREGGDRRDAAATLENDPVQGDTTINSTIYEQRTSIMVNDPGASNAVRNFDKFGCFIACHNQSRHMPEWTSASGHDGKYIDLNMVADGGKSSRKVLDLWHWRGARSNPIWRADDQWIEAKTFVDKSKKDEGGRHGDAGKGVFRSQQMKDGHPTFVLDPSTTWGRFAFKWEDFWVTPFYYMTDPDAVALGPTAPNPKVMAWGEAIHFGYKPSEGDVVPRRVLRAGAGSRADITAFGTRFVPTTMDGSLGVWKVQMQRKLDTGNDDDIALQPGNVYDAGFEVHLWEYTTRDHYISFPKKFSLGPDSDADIEAVRLPGKGSFPLPNWGNADRFPAKRLYLFQPGITSWEFLTGKNDADGKVYIDPLKGKPVEQDHSGEEEVLDGSMACVECHTVLASDPPTEEDAGSMELLTGGRGGIWTATPFLKH